MNRIRNRIRNRSITTKLPITIQYAIVGELSVLTAYNKNVRNPIIVN